MRSTFRSILLGLLAAGAFTACADAGSPLSIDATGEMAVQVFLDRNGSGENEPGVDLPAVGLRVALLRPGGDTVTTATTDAGGVVVFRSLDLGTYRLGVNPSVLGDSLRLEWPDTALAVTARATAMVKLPIGYPLITARQLAAYPAGRLVTSRGVALHALNVFGDSLLHVEDSTGVVRVSSAQTVAIGTGDSVRVTGRTGLHGGRPALLAASIFRVAAAPTPQPRTLSTQAAAAASAGGLDGALVQVLGARVISVTNLPQGELRIRVTDGSGPLDVFFDRHAAISTDDQVVAGVLLDAAGILVPREGFPGEWMLKPRGSLDVRVTIPRVTTAAARAMVAGSLVEIHAIALNGVATFGDNTVHMVDASGALRAINVSTSFQFAGDSIRAVGVLAIREGQMTLTQTTVTVLGKSTVPPPTHLTTDVARTANGGARDAALVEVRNAEVKSLNAPAGGDAVLRVDDGTGELVVILDRDTGIGTAGLAVGDRADLVGVLVPTGTGTWQLKPRTPADVIRR